MKRLKKSSGTGRRPNIIMVMADDMGYGDFGRFNSGRSRTHAIDQLSFDGVCLTQHYSASCVCTPARAGFLTGRYPHRTGAIEMRSIRGLDRIALREKTIGDCFIQAGYRTGLIGKWHTGVYGREYHPNRRGFDEFIGFRGGCMDYWDWRIERNGRLENADGRYLTDVFTDEAVSFLRRHSAEPFFLCLHYNAPHTPLQAPDNDLSAFLDFGGGVTRGVSCVYAMINVMDRGIARVREELRRSGLEENTLLMFTSDNGPAMYGTGEKCMARFNCNFNGGKGSVYEGGIRVPAVLNWPAGGLSGGGEMNFQAHFTDWLPTFLSAAGVNPPEALNLDGVNLLPKLQGEEGTPLPMRFWQWNRFLPMLECNAAVREGNWKLVRPRIEEALWTSPEEMEMDRHLETHPEEFTDILRTPFPHRTIHEIPPLELYNLAEDPGESRNLAKINQDVTDRLNINLEKWFESVERDRLSITELNGPLKRRA